MAQRFLDREGILIVLLSGLSLAFLIAAGLALWNPPADETMPPVRTTTTQTPPAVQDTSVTPEKPVEIDLEGKDGVSVLDLLKRDHTVKLDSALLIFGSIVLAIDTVEARPDQVWTYYRDSIPGDKSPEVCITKSGEEIRWVLKKRK